MLPCFEHHSEQRLCLIPMKIECWKSSAMHSLIKTTNEVKIGLWVTSVVISLL